MKPFLISSLFILVLTLFSSSAYAQSNYRFKRINESQGLSSLDVLSIVEDNEGFIWFGTQDGLNRYDGIHCRVFRNDKDDPDSISDNWVQIIYNDEKGNLWIGTQNGLNLYDPQRMSFRHWKHVPEDPSSLSHDDVYSITSAGPGLLWIGTRGGGLNLFDIEKGTFKSWMHDPSDPSSLNNNSILSIWVNHDQTLYVGTEGSGLFLFDPSTETFSKIIDPQHPEISESESIIWDLKGDQDGNIWIGSNDYLSRYNPQKEVFEHRKVVEGVDRIETIYIESTDKIWYGSRGRGLIEVDLATNQSSINEHHKYNLNSLSHNEVVEIYEDSHGIIWLGTHGGGADILNESGKVFEYFFHISENPNSLIHDGVRALYEDNDKNIWIGTNGGLSVFDPNTYQFRNYTCDPANPNGINHQRIRSILQTHDGNVWIGSEGGGLSQYIKSEDRFEHYGKDVFGDIALYFRTLYEDPNGFIWIGSFTGGLIRFDPQTKEVKNWTFSPANPDGLPDNRVQIIIPHGDGQLWIGSNEGLSLFNPSTEKFTTWKHMPHEPNSLGNNKIRSILKQDTFLWIGTRGGFSRFDIEHNTFRNFNTKDGLPSEVIFGVLADESGMIWLTTPNGLSHFDTETETFKNVVIPYNNHLDMGGYCKASNGDFIVGGPEGVTRFNPKNVVNNQDLPPVVFTNLSIFDESVIASKNINFMDELVLSFRDNMLSFEFAALNYKFSERNEYAYKLEGADRNWFYTHENHATYSNLLPGNYIFKVKASNNDGLWNETPTTIAIRIIPPFWMRLWFKLSILVLLILSVLLFIQYRTYRMKKINTKLEENVRRRTQELVESNALLSATKDELHTTLNALQEAVISTDETGMILASNRAAKDFFALESDSPKNHAIKDALNLHQCSPTGGSLGSDAFIIENRIYESELCAHDHGKKKRFFSISSSPHYDQKKKITGYVFVFRDMTKKIQMENQLALTSKMESIGHLAAGIAHEINTPLQYIGSNREFIASAIDAFKSFFNVIITSYKSDDKESKIEAEIEESDIEYLLEESGNAINDMQDGFKSIARIVSAMKVFGHPSMGEKSLIDINQAIENALTISRNTWKYVSDIEQDFDEKISYIKGQPDELNQVFLNLIINASHAIKDKIDASENRDEKGLIKVSTRQDEQWTQIMFQDSGCGIKEDSLEQIFDPFFTTKPVGQGTGQGLAISHDIIVNKHQGKIEVNSIPGEGTTFTISLPMHT